MRQRSYKTEKNHIEVKVNAQSFDEVRKFLSAAVAKHNRNSEEKISYDITAVSSEKTEKESYRLYSYTFRDHSNAV